MSLALYVIGPPGAGKSTLVAELVGPLGAQHDQPVPHVVYPSGWTEIGRRRGAFSGTDALSYSIAPAARAWVLSPARPARLAGEGDRLATDGFLGALEDAYDRLVVAAISISPAVSYERMTARAEALGRAPQAMSWWKGRYTKAVNVAERWGALRLDGQASPHQLAREILEKVAQRY